MGALEVGESITLFSAYILTQTRGGGAFSPSQHSSQFPKKIVHALAFPSLEKAQHGSLEATS